jgi:hypothetical protein
MLDIWMEPVAGIVDVRAELRDNGIAEQAVISAFQGVVRDIGVGGYRRERIVGGKWSRAARRTWRAGVSDSDESEGDMA